MMSDTSPHYNGKAKRTQVKSEEKFPYIETIDKGVNKRTVKRRTDQFRRNN